VHALIGNHIINR